MHVVLAMLGICTALSQGAVAATRLGLHVTQEELNIWRARRTDSVNTINGFTYQSIYQNRILEGANFFKNQSHPGGDGWWAGYTGSGCAPDFVGGSRVRPVGQRYERGAGVDLMRSAFVFLLTGDLSYATPVRTELLSVIAQPGTQWSNTSKWCPNPSSYPTTWEISPWIGRLLVAYDYLNAGGYTGFSAADHTNIKKWFNDAAVIFHEYHMDGINIIGAYPGIFNEPPSFACTGANCTQNNALLYWQGPVIKTATNFTFYGQAVASPVLSMLVGVLNNNPTHISNAKKYITGFIRAGIFDNGAMTDYHRWAETVCFNLYGHGCPGGMWGHLPASIGGITGAIDVLARTGDTSLYTLTGPTQMPGGSGGTVGWQLAMELWAKLANRTVILYGADNLADVLPETILTWDSDVGACCGRYEDFSMMPGNLFYQNSHVTTAMRRNTIAANSHVATGNAATGGCNDHQFGGCFAGSILYELPDVPFMYGNMEGVVNPYGVTLPPPGAGVTVDSTFAGYTTAPIDDGVINATGGPATTWASAETATDHWIVIAFGASQQINSATLHWAFNQFQSAYMTSNRVDVQYWDGSAYQTAATMTYAGDVPSTTVNFAAVSTSQIRFYQQANQGPPNYPGVIWLTEVDYGTQTPTLPSPPTNLRVISAQ
jgi:hypothetical protein